MNLLELKDTAEMPAPEGWTHRSIPWMLPKYWETLTKILGEDNIKIIASTSMRNRQGKVFTRGQIFISDAGMARLKAPNEESSAKSAETNSQ